MRLERWPLQKGTIPWRAANLGPHRSDQHRERLTTTQRSHAQHEGIPVSARKSGWRYDSTPYTETLTLHRETALPRSTGGNLTLSGNPASGDQMKVEAIGRHTPGDRPTLKSRINV